MYRCVLLISVTVYQLRHICVSSVIQLSTFRVVGVVICTKFCNTIFILVYAYLESRNVHYIRRNWGHSFGVVTKLRSGWLGILVQFSTAAGDMSVLQDVRPVSEAHPRVQEAVFQELTINTYPAKCWEDGCMELYHSSHIYLNGEVLHWTQGQICLSLSLSFFYVPEAFRGCFQSIHVPWLYRVKPRLHSTTFVPSHYSLIIRN